MQMAKILAANTNYATMVTGPRYEKNKLRFIQLSPMEKGKLLAVVVLGGNIVRNNILDIGEDISPEDVLQLNLLLNKNLTGLCMEEINLGIISRMKEEAGAYSEVVSKVLDSVGGISFTGGSFHLYQRCSEYIQVPGAVRRRQGQRADQHAGGEEESRYDYVG